MENLNIFDNKIIIFLFLFLPFSQALTLNIGFPLKISEIMLLVLIFITVASKPFILNRGTLRDPLFLLLVWSLFCVLINLSWSYGYDLNLNYNSRAGYEIDSILKWFYFLLAVLMFYFSSKAFSANKEKYIRYLLFGAIAASLYSWYLFVSSVLGITPILLPGMGEEIQTITLFGKEIIRCGTFKEGNFMAFFLFLSTVIALYGKQTKIALFLALSILTTASTIGILVLLFFWCLTLLKESKTKRGVLRLLFVFFVSLFALLALLQNDAFNTMFVSKLDITSSEITDQGAYSKEDRKNTIVNGGAMSIDNPVFGVGLSNFAAHYKFYNEKYGSGFENYDFKVIQNNIYVEIFSELGLIGILLFGFFLYRLYVDAKKDESKILLFGLIGSFVYFMAFPSFTVLFIWVYFGLINSLPKDKYAVRH